MPIRRPLLNIVTLCLLIGSGLLLGSCGKPTPSEGDSTSESSNPDGPSTGRPGSPVPTGSAAAGQRSATSTPSDNSPGPEQAPLMVQPAVVDFGVVDPGTLLDTVVTLANISNAPLRILNAQPSCTCTTLDLENTVIPARSSIEVPISMQTNRAVGLKMALVQLRIEGYGRFTTIDLKAETAWAVRTQPLYLGVRERADQPERRQGTIVLQSLDRRPFQILSTNGQEPEFIDFDPNADKPRANYTIKYDLSMYGCEDLPPYYIIRTDHPKAELFDMRVRHDPCTRITPKINMEDFRSSLGVVKPGEQLSVPLVFKKPRANIVSATSTDPMLDTRIIERVPDGKNIKVQVLTTVSPDAPEGLFQIPIQFTDGSNTVEHMFYGWVEE